MARMVATKAALSIRLDALADADSKSSLDSATIGLESRVKLESRLRLLEQGIGHTSLRSIAKSHDAKAGNQPKFELSGNGAKYNDAADTLLPTATPVAGSSAMEVDGEDEKKAAKAAKKEKKRKAAEEEAAAADMSVDVVVEGEDVRSPIPVHFSSIETYSPIHHRKQRRRNENVRRRLRKLLPLLERRRSWWKRKKLRRRKRTRRRRSPSGRRMMREIKRTRRSLVLESIIIILAFRSFSCVFHFCHPTDCFSFPRLVRRLVSSRRSSLVVGHTQGSYANAQYYLQVLSSKTMRC